METLSNQSDNKGVFASCRECLKLKLPWKKPRTQAKRRSTGSICDVTTTFYPPSKRQQGRVGGLFKYDPLSYAQNFDDTVFDYDEECYSHGFSFRFAAPVPKTFPTATSPELG